MSDSHRVPGRLRSAWVPLPLIIRYGAAVLAVAAAYALRRVLETWAGPGLPMFITFYPLVMVVALLAGLGPGLLATLLTVAVAAQWIMQPVGNPATLSLVDRVALVLFGIMGVFMSVVSELYRRNRRKAAAYDKEEALRRSERRYRSFVEVTSQFAWVTDADGLVVEDIPELRNFTGQTYEQARGAGWASALHPEDVQHTLEVWNRAVSTRTPYEVEYRMRRHDGVYRRLLARGVPILDERGNVEEWVGTCIDITERKQAEEKVRQRTEELSALLDAVPAYIWFSSDADCQVITGNRAANEMTGVAPGTNVSQSAAAAGRAPYLRQLKPDGTEYRPDDLPMQRAVATQQPVRDALLDFQFADGRRVRTIGNALPLFDAAGAVRGSVAAFFDITARKQAEEALQQLNVTLEQRVAERTAEVRQQADQLRALAAELSQTEQRERKRLAAILHDHIQQLLVAARMQLELVKRAEPEAVSSIVQGVESIVKEAIDASRSLTVELSPPILHQAGLAAGLGWLANYMQEKHLFKVHVQADHDAAPASESARFLLFESVRELLLNAVKHSGTREARVTMARTGQGWTQIVVEDRGQGFDAGALRARQARDGGFGLFSIHQRLVHMGGHLEIESASGSGARVILSLPPEQRAEEAAAPAAAAPEGGAVTMSIREPSRKISVLLADDHEIVRQGLAAILQLESDLEVIAEAEDGRQAVELARKHKPHVVVIDVNMPGMDGVEATRIITRELPHIKVIGLSMHFDSNIAAAMRKAGAAGYLAKGGPFEDLAAAIRACSPGRTEPA